MNTLKPYTRFYKDEYLITNTQSSHAEELASLQEIVFPTLSTQERFQAAQYQKHVSVFPEGQFVVLHKQKVIAGTSTLRYDFNLAHPFHTFGDILAGGYLETHQPDGRWLYGLDVSVHPSHRGRGIARLIYHTRHELVRLLGLEGQVIVGMMSGYGRLRHTLTAQAYFEKVITSELFDPTVSVQMKMGFEPRVLIPNYLNDPVCDNYGILLTLDATKNISL